MEMKNIHSYDFHHIFTAEEKKEVIKKIAKRNLARGMSKEDALKRAKQEIMPDNKYKKFAYITLHICSIFKIPTTSEYIDMSVNRNGEHSWYVTLSYFQLPFYKLTHPLKIRISDHSRHYKSVLERTHDIELIVSSRRKENLVGELRKKIEEALLYHTLPMEIQEKEQLKLKQLKNE
ncbi:hypothetical protein EZS27_021457 [termite gut metagenome]|uniref:Uncharacterized protein n=1 Tax=termite gut metagenome TaxID=433724 RepID=A0A5J4R9Y5_9ZZZZ